jgi:putative tricarboxylic transport membrane protein
MVAFGLIGFVLREMEYPMAPLVLGIILGDILDKNMRRALILSDGSLVPFFTRPISVVLMAITVLMIISRLPVTENIAASI